jgi:hypothetical protein
MVMAGRISGQKPTGQGSDDEILLRHAQFEERLEMTGLKEGPR